MARLPLQLVLCLVCTLQAWSSCSCRPWTNARRFKWQHNFTNDFRLLNLQMHLALLQNLKVLEFAKEVAVCRVSDAGSGLCGSSNVSSTGTTWQRMTFAQRESLFNCYTFVFGIFARCNAGDEPTQRSRLPSLTWNNTDWWYNNRIFTDWFNQGWRPTETGTRSELAACRRAEPNKCIDCHR